VGKKQKKEDEEWDAKGLLEKFHYLFIRRKVFFKGGRVQGAGGRVKIQNAV